MTSQTASGQLDKLEEMAYVRKTPVGRESLYELREPLLRMVIEVKRGHNEPVRLIVDFLRRWYDRRERQERLALASTQHPLTRAYLTASLDLERAVQDVPDLEQARQFSAEYAKCLKAKQFGRACELAAEVIERKGTACSSDDWFEYALCLSATDQHSAAIAIWNKVVSHDPGDVVAWNNRGCTLSNLAIYSEAIKSYDRALTLDPNYAGAWYNRGLALYAMGNYPEALANYDKAIALDPNHADAWNDRGVALYAMGDYLASLASYAQALKLDPDFASAWNNHGAALMSLDDYSASLASYDQALTLNFDDAHAWNNRGVALTNLGNYSAALASYDRALSLDPNSAKAWFNRADAQLALGHWGGFFEHLDRGFAAKSTNETRIGDTEAYCRRALRAADFADKITSLTCLYEQHGALEWLGQGLTASIPEIFESRVSQATAEEWLGAWQAACGETTELEIPVRLLEAAVEWKKTRSVRALLVLPIEERRILESLLPALSH
jgi:tetratricopeptide (TPR) repeat protein